MGWLHVNNAGWGMYLNEEDINGINPRDLITDSIAPTAEEADAMRKKREVWFKDESQEKIHFVMEDEAEGTGLDKLDAAERALVTYALDNYSWTGTCQDFRGHHDWEKFARKLSSDPDDIRKLSSDPDDIRSIMVNYLSVRFAADNSLPSDMFKSVRDYNGDYMIYCTQTYPLPEERLHKLQDFSLEKYREMLNRFLNEITGNKTDRELEWCEEYIKE